MEQKSGIRRQSAKQHDKSLPGEALAKYTATFRSHPPLPDPPNFFMNVFTSKCLLESPPSSESGLKSAVETSSGPGTSGAGQHHRALKNSKETLLLGDRGANGQSPGLELVSHCCHCELWNSRSNSSCLFSVVSSCQCCTACQYRGN